MEFRPFAVTAALRRQRERFYGPEKQGGIQRGECQAVTALLAEGVLSVSERIDIEVAPVFQGVPAEKVEAVGVAGPQLGKFRVPRAVHQPVMQVFLVRQALEQGEVFVQESRVKRHAPGVDQYIYRYSRGVCDLPEELPPVQQFVVACIFLRQRIRIDKGLHVPGLVRGLDVLGTYQIREYDRKGDKQGEYAKADFLENDHCSPPSRRYLTSRISPKSFTVCIETESW